MSSGDLPPFSDWWANRHGPHNRFRETLYRILVVVSDLQGTIVARFALERRGDAMATACSHHAWAASQSNLNIQMTITNVQPVAPEPHTSGRLPSL